MSDKPSDGSGYYVTNDDGSKRRVGSVVPEPSPGGGSEMPLPNTPLAKLDEATLRQINKLIASDPSAAPADWLGELLKVVRAIGKQQPPDVEYCNPDDWPPSDAVEKLAALLSTGSGIAKRMTGLTWLQKYLADLSVKASDQEFWLYGQDIEQIDRARAEVISAQTGIAGPVNGGAGDAGSNEVAERRDEDQFVFSMRATFDRVRFLVERVEDLTVEEHGEREAWLTPPMSGCPQAGMLYRWDRHIEAFFHRVGAKYDIPDFAAKVISWSRDFLGCATHGTEVPFDVPTFDELSRRLDDLLDEWGTLVVVRRIQAAGRSTTDAPKRPNKAPPSRSQTVSTRDRKRKWLAEALLLRRDHPEWSDRRIAAEVGVAPSTLSRAPEYQRAAGLARGDAKDLRKGHVSENQDTGQRDIDAYDFTDPADGVSDD